MFAPLVNGYRADNLEIVKFGCIAVVNENGEVIHSAGDPEFMTFYRSTSKPIQLLPMIMRGLHEKYNMSQREIAVMCSSHLAEPIHVETIAGLLEKGGFKEDDFIMKPNGTAFYKDMPEKFQSEDGKRKIFHNCSGKHTGLLYLCRETDADYHDYYKMESNAQQEIVDVISKVSECPREKIAIGTDGCGVPVYCVPLKNAAISYLKLSNPDLEKDPAISKALATNAAAMNAHPEMIRGHGTLCHAINGDPNLNGKLGAAGVYTIGMRNERKGIAIKFIDGSVDALPIVVKSVLQQMGYQNDELYAKLDALPGWRLFNDNDLLVGHFESAFKF